MTRSKYPFALFLGAGASKPLGIPTTDEMAKGLLETIDSKYLRSLPNCNDLDIESLISNIKLCKELKDNPSLGFIHPTDRDLINEVSNEFEKDLETTFIYIRNRCSKPNVEKAKELYGPIFELSEVASIKIFTTNYDTSIEDAAKNLKIKGNDGFVLTPFEDFPTFDHTSFDKDSKYELFKLHGSINWWSDDSKTFRLSLDLAGTEKIRNLMIYPSQDKDTSTYPYYILQSIFDYTLNSIDELIAIGHRFNDHKITSSIKATLDRNEKFVLTIVNPDATALKNQLFEGYNNVVPLDCTFEDWIVKNVGSIRDKAIEYNENKENKLNEYNKMLRKEHIQSYRDSKEFKNEINSAEERGKNSVTSITNSLINTDSILSGSSMNSNDVSKIDIDPNIFTALYDRNHKVCDRCYQEFPSMLSNESRCFSCRQYRNCRICKQEFLSTPLSNETLCTTCKMTSNLSV